MLTFATSSSAPAPGPAGAAATPFVDTTPFGYDEALAPAQRLAVESYRVLDPRRLAQTLANLQRLETPIRIGLPESGAFFSATLWSVDAHAERMVLRAARERAVVEIVTNPARLWAAAYDANSKVQFDLRGRTFRPDGDFWVVSSYLPSAMYLLPRRGHVRTRHAAGVEPHIQFTLPDGGPAVSLPIHDISQSGLSFLLSPEQGRLAVGTQVAGAEIELAPGEFLFADLRVCNVMLHDQDGGQLRFGCAWTLLPPQAMQLIERWTRRSRQRRHMLTLDL